MCDSFIYLYLCISLVVHVAHLLSFLSFPIMCLYVLRFLLWCQLRIPHKNNVRLFVGGLMCYLCYLCYFAYIGVKHILYCVFLRFGLCTLFNPFLWIVYFWIPLPYSLSFIIYIWEIICWWNKFYEYLSCASYELSQYTNKVIVKF